MPQKPAVIQSHTYQKTGNKDILRFVDRNGDWTHYWIKSKKIFVPAVNHIIRTGYPKGERFYNYLLHANPTEAERRLKTAGEEGSRTHDAIKDLITGKKITVHSKYFNELSQRFDALTHEEWQNLEAFARWCAKYNPEVVLFEQAVWSEIYSYAGTIDFIGTILIPEGDKLFPRELWNTRILILLDWKTSGGIWDDYELQIASYWQAAREKMQAIVPFQQYPALWTGIVRLGTQHTSGFEMKWWDEKETDENFCIFKSVLEIYKKKTGQQSVPEMRSIPAEFKITIPKVKKTKIKKSDTVVV